MDEESEGIRDHRSESDEEESHDEEGGDNGSEDSSRDGNEEDEEFDDEDPSDDDMDDSDECDDEEDPLEDVDCEDKEDRDAFIGTDISKEEYLNIVLPLKHNDEKLTTFYLRGKDRMSDEAWARLGVFLGRHTHLRQICIESCNMTANNLALLFGSGPFNNNSIAQLVVFNCPAVGSEGVTALKPFFKKASSLTTLSLCDINLGLEGIKFLSLELGGLPNLKQLMLRSNNIGDTGLEGISTLCFSKLNHLHLAGNGIGRRGCEALTDLLRSDESSLISLYLRSNAINDECAEIFSRSLANNTTLRQLDLNVNDNISCVGLESFLRLVCDTSSVNRTFESNHTLTEIHNDHNRNLPANLHESFWTLSTPHAVILKCALNDNRGPGAPKDKACRKVIKHHFQGGANVSPLLDMDTKLMPHVLSWTAQRRDEDFDYGCRKNFVYHILRNLIVPSL